MRIRIVSLISGLALALATVGAVSAHPNVPEQSICVLPMSAADGIHQAAMGPAGGKVAGHVLYVKSPHYCEN